MQENHYTKNLPEECCAKCRKYSRVGVFDGYCMTHRRSVKAKDELPCFSK